MATEIDICNLALTHIGDPGNVASIDPPEASTQARYCARLYPLARDEILEAHPWRFATRRLALSSVTLPAAFKGEWQFAYALPTGCLRPLAVYVPGLTDVGGVEAFTIEAVDNAGAQLVLANVDGAFLRYITSIEDANRYPPSFVLALSYLLASKLASPLTRNGEIIGAMDKIYRVGLEEAKRFDAAAQNAEQWHEEASPFWLASR